MRRRKIRGRRVYRLSFFLFFLFISYVKHRKAEEATSRRDLRRICSGGEKVLQFVAMIYIRRMKEMMKQKKNYARPHKAVCELKQGDPPTEAYSQVMDF